MKNRVVGSLCRAIGSQHRVICGAESQCRAKEARKSGVVSVLTTLLAFFRGKK